jgi:hypothetical protein
MLSPEYKDAKEILQDKSLGSPIKLQHLSAETIMEFILSLKNKWKADRICSS